MKNHDHAKRIGAKVFSNESACPHCQTFARYTINRACVECQKAKNRARLANPETMEATRKATRERVAKHYANKKLAAAKQAENNQLFDDILG